MKSFYKIIFACFSIFGISASVCAGNCGDVDVSAHNILDISVPDCSENISQQSVSFSNESAQTFAPKKTSEVPTSLVKKTPEAPTPIVLTLDDGTKMTFMPIPAGTFIMGSPKTEPGREDNENQVRVNITKPFYLAQTETTCGQYIAIMDDDSPISDGKNDPVTNVLWKEAMTVCETLTKWAHDKGLLSGWKFTLPTEAQWEYACRAGTTTAWSFGDNPKLSEMKEHMWYGESWGFGPYPVAQKKPNAWGLYDMHGNVKEWCLDGGRTWCLLPMPSLPGGNDPVVEGESGYRIVRGGSYWNTPQDCRSARRGDNPTGERLWCSGIGFRIALVQE